MNRLALLVAFTLSLVTTPVALPAPEPPPIYINIHRYHKFGYPLEFSLRIPRHRENTYFCVWFGTPKTDGILDVTGEDFYFFRRSCQSLDGIYEPTYLPFSYSTGPLPAVPAGDFIIGADLLRRQGASYKTERALQHPFTIRDWRQ